ncbi:MAG: hypothetical protein DM484_00830 [Candidatus Methylumidiphilus alinenensis]|uniref:Uncharacterized protein n=1 Tax=Candidatus Methylumidiphilus alinenensis TaxID=2202197 RepID=A0A2W4TWR2_9GAMM|nr:MAG: hypothetical protein DM484_00830 [Candidatus Methylumidiphilus alinenensis]
MSAGLGFGQGRYFARLPSQKRKRAAQPETRPKAERGNHGPDGLHHAGLEHRGAGTNRHTANDNQSPKKHVVQTDAFPSSTATAK